jgi:hypothetical protein
MHKLWIFDIVPSLHAWRGKYVYDIHSVGKKDGVTELKISSLINDFIFREIS